MTLRHRPSKYYCPPVVVILVVFPPAPAVPDAVPASVPTPVPIPVPSPDAETPARAIEVEDHSTNYETDLSHDFVETWHIILLPDYYPDEVLELLGNLSPPCTSAFSYDPVYRRVATMTVGTLADVLKPAAGTMRSMVAEEIPGEREARRMQKPRRHEWWLQ